MVNIKRVIIFVIIIAAILGGAYWWHIRKMDELSQQISEEQSRKALMDQRIQEIEDKLATSESEKEALLEEIEELLVEEVTVFDSEAIKEEMLEIGELATVEYRYTNVGTLDASKKFSFVDWEIPLSKKTAVVTMDGVIKAGVNMSDVQVVADESAKLITITIPEAKILSNELFEDTLAVYVEEDSVFSRITLDDSSSIRNDIKNKAQKNALDSGMLKQAKEKAGEIVRYMIESVPEVKDTYKIVIK